MPDLVQCAHCGDIIPANSPKAGQAQYHCSCCLGYYVQLQQTIQSLD